MWLHLQKIDQPGQTPIVLKSLFPQRGFGNWNPTKKQVSEIQEGPFYEKMHWTLISRGTLLWPLHQVPFPGNTSLTQSFYSIIQHVAKAQVNVFWDCFLERCFFLVLQRVCPIPANPKTSRSFRVVVFQIDSSGKFWVWVVWRPFSAQNARIGSFLRPGDVPLEVGDVFVLRHTPESLGPRMNGKMQVLGCFVQVWKLSDRS